MSAVGPFADPPQSLLFCGISGHGVFVPTCVSNVRATSCLEAGAETLLTLALPLSLALAFASITLTLSPLPPLLG